jgi:phosphoenolpyruvate synthase/pyruvate phosphate dikinase
VVVVAAAVVGGDNGDTLDATGKPMSSVVSVVVLVVNVAVDLVDLVAFDFDERDPGMKEMLRLAVEGAKRNGKHVGICGQAPSDYPEIAEYLVRMGIDSISLNPDTVVRATRRILEIERELGKMPRI